MFSSENKNNKLIEFLECFRKSRNIRIFLFRIQDLFVDIIMEIIFFFNGGIKTLKKNELF